MLAMVLGCGHEWDDLDPRLAGAGGATTSSAGIGAAGPGPSGSTTTGGVGAQGGSTSSAAGSTSSAGGAGGSSATTGGGGALAFFDDFNRPDDQQIGNGWLQKTPNCFDLIGNVVVKNAPGGSYKDNLVYRPGAEALLDVEVSAELEFTTAVIERPQLLVRIQMATILTPDGYDGYKVWIPASATQALLARQVGTGGSTTLATITVSPGFVQGERYRIRLRAVGTTPVQLDAYVELYNGMSWVGIGTASYADSDPARVTTPGVAAFSGATDTGYFFDNYGYDPM